MLADLSIWHILILVLVIMLVFGTKRIPEIGSSIGKGIQEFKRGLRDVTSDDAPPAAPPPPPTSGVPKRLSDRV
ncbi:MAG TPA: twin-arginine translocase TatA/TatE family subunit [Gemmatimonadales bacterium]|nr:twin-arginine translocase TatA/TatE family subunit [Gemmatimonadales bacterium]